jgi:hypothetical protein
MAPEITVVSNPKRRLPGAANNGVLNELQIAGCAAFPSDPRNETFPFYPTRAILSIIYVRLCTYCFVSDRMYPSRNALSPRESRMKMGAVAIEHSAESRLAKNSSQGFCV